LKSNRRFKTAFILGAGLGTRLRPLTERCPKPLLDIGGRPAITYAMDHLLTVGVERFIVNTHHFAHVYHEKFPEARWRAVPIVFRHEPALLDTAGGLKNIEDLLEEDESILCYNGDVIADFPLAPLLEWHQRLGAEATLALRSTGPNLNVNVDERGYVCDLRHTLDRPGVRRCLFTGVYCVEQRLIRGLEAGKIESIIPVFVRRIEQHPESIAAVVLDEGAWSDIGSIEEYERLVAQAEPHNAELRRSVE
jgi:NDP-sugar pyrophosphorylase family protein